MKFFWLLGLQLFSLTGVAIAKISGEIVGEVRYFWNQGDYGQEQEQLSIYTLVEYYSQWNDGKDTLTFSPFFRIDSMDDERTHGDIRELYWNHIEDDWELRAGIRKVFWGVAESQHLVDIINQTDFVENPDSEDKLGQPMVNVSLSRDWGVLDVFALVGFRDRTFSGEQGRFRFALPVKDDSIYESGAEEKRIDFAIRWSHFIGDWDIGLAHFSGTSREPQFMPLQQGSKLSLVPYYPVIEQTSIDLQATIDAWLWKFEGYTRSGFTDRLNEGRVNKAVGGFEYTLYGIMNSATDLGAIVEYQYDSRDKDESGTSIHDNWVVGARFALNDEMSTELLIGYIAGVNVDAKSYFVEASRRVNESWSLSFEARGVTGIDDDDVTESFLYPFRHDDFAQLNIEYYF